MSDCFENIISLSQTTCPCFDEGKPEDYNVSTSGVVLDQLEGFNLAVFGSADDCARGNLWERLAKNRLDAIADLKSDLLGCIGQNYKSRYDIFAGQLGDAAFKTVQNLSNNFAGIKIFPAQMRGGIIKLKRFGIIVNASVNVTVDVYKLNGNPETGDSTLIASYTTPTPVTANTLTWLAISGGLELPMWSYNGRIDYFVVLRLDGTFQPVDNRRDCNCGGIERPWLTWIDFKGVKGDDATDLKTFTQTNSINGLVLDVELKCKTAELICSDERPLDFENDPFAKYLAYAVRFKTGAKGYKDVYTTDQINRQSLMNRDEIIAWAKEWDKLYGDCVSYLCSIINIDRNDCLVCRDTTQFGKLEIKV